MKIPHIGLLYFIVLYEGSISIYRWARLISASTWEEIREESEGNYYMEKARDEMIKMSRDESER